MKIFSAIFLMGTIFSSSAFAKDFHLKCVASYNADKVLETEVKLPAGVKSLGFGSFEEFDFYLTQTGENTVELQALYNADPSRSYATAKLTDSSSFVELSIWRREFIMEVRCTVID
jgi:hypothetical protein